MSITIKRACEIVQKELPKMRIMSCTESSMHYLFHLEPRRWNGIGSGAAGGSINFVDKKSGIFDMMNIDWYYEKYGCNGFKKVDIKPFLSKEDIDFIEMVERNRAS